MSQTNLNPQQTRIKALADNIVLQDKIKRRVILDEITALNQKLTTDQQTAIVNAIGEGPALRFLSATGIRGDARKLLFAKLSVLESQ